MPRRPRTSRFGEVYHRRSSYYRYVPYPLVVLSDPIPIDAIPLAVLSDPSAPIPDLPPNPPVGHPELIVETEAQPRFYNLRPRPTSTAGIQTTRLTEIVPGEDTLCSFCQYDMKLDEKIRETPCGHKFHDKCIVDWLLFQNFCPKCRREFAAL